MYSLKIYQYSFEVFQQNIIILLNQIVPFIYHQPIYFSIILMFLLYLLNWLTPRKQYENKEKCINILFTILNEKNINEKETNECRNILLKHPDIANMCLPDNCSTTFLQFACKQNHTELIKIMLLCGGDVHIRGKNGSTLFHMVTYHIVYNKMHCKTDTLKLLLCAGCDINAQQKCGFTALHIAAIFGHTDLCRWLLDIGIQPNIVSDIGLTAADLADLNDYPHVADLIDTYNKIETQNNSIKVFNKLFI